MADDKALTAPLLDRARAWALADPEPATRAELERLIEAGDVAELTERMSGTLQFGTAGLRGIVGAGSARMNRAVVIRTTRGLCDTLLARATDARTLPVVVGFDGRLDSRRFAEDVAGVLLAAGIPVRFFEQSVPTPFVAYAARQLGANAAVVITASHNPAEYNGYKLYGGDAVQIAPPLDAEIAARIERVGAANAVPRVEHALSGSTGPHAAAERIDPKLFDRYLAELAALRPRVAPVPELRIAYTPLHGVGRPFAERALAVAGYTDVHVVADQAEPDGHFPTVPFPNPEEPGVLDRVLALASDRQADLVLANDPDADRLAVAVPAPGGGFQALTGNQVGILLADHLLSGAPSVPRPLVVRSVVSSPLLDAVAESYGAHAETTLTGFKWLYSAALDLERSGGLRFLFGYEEALGYGAGWLVRDKDGISAAVLFADVAANCRARGVTVLEHLDALLARHGNWISVQKSVVLPGSDGATRIAAALERLAAAPPSQFAGRALTGLTDYRIGAESRPRWLGRADLIELELEGGVRVFARPSGTEPKLKIYVDLRAPSSEAAARHAAESDAHMLADALVSAMGL